jgi:dimethylamine monooxygenase subunit A
MPCAPEALRRAPTTRLPPRFPPLTKRARAQPQPQPQPDLVPERVGRQEREIGPGLGLGLVWSRVARTADVGNSPNQMSSYPPMYFPISPRPLNMAAGLKRFGTDFGQAERDHEFFQLDRQRAHYLRAKRQAPAERRVIVSGDPQAARARAAALAWMRSTLAEQAPQVLVESACDSAALDELDALARTLQEDFCVMCAGEDFAGSAALIDVRFPSGWRPERLAGADFRSLHAPVPGFPGDERAAQSMVRTMIERGPFVRFVWTLSPDDRLDQHPDAPRQAGWDQSERAWLRVERQITVPLPAASASLFLIRVYHYALDELTADQRARAIAALAMMPEPLRRYKNLPSPATLDAVFARGAGRARSGLQSAACSTPSVK